jgi:Cation transporting ATPase, C-terminus
MAAFFFVLNVAGWKYGESLAARDPAYLQATTACLSAIIVMQIVNVFLCRSATRSVFSTGLRGNTLIIVGVISEIAVLLLITYTPWGNSLLGTAPVGGKVWGVIIPFAVGMFFLEELRKWLARRRLLGLYFPQRCLIAAHSLLDDGSGCHERKGEECSDTEEDERREMIPGELLYRTTDRNVTASSVALRRGARGNSTVRVRVGLARDRHMGTRHT